MSLFESITAIENEGREREEGGGRAKVGRETLQKKQHKVKIQTLSVGGKFLRVKDALKVNGREEKIDAQHTDIHRKKMPK